MSPVSTAYADGLPPRSSGRPGSAVDPGLGARLADDPDALTECYERYGAMVLAYLRRLVGPADAEDVLQQVFLDLWRSRARYDPTRPLEPWIISIAHRRAVDHLRRETRRDAPVVSLTEPDLASADRFVEEFAEAQVIGRALGELSSEQRETLVLAYYNDLTQTQIAGRMNVPLGTVKARSQRGLRRLAALLVPEEES